MVFFAWVTVLLWILLWRLAYADPMETSGAQLPPAPTLSLSPPYSIFVRGELICLTCSLPEGQRTETFFFHKLKEDDQLFEYTRQGQSTLEVSTLHLEPKETFICSYWAKNTMRRSSRSQLSNPAVFSVTDHLPAPSLSADPSGPQYLPREKVILRCSAPRDARRMQYHFFHYRDHQIPERIPPQNGSAWLTRTATRENSGEYICQYSKSESERDVFSQRSRPIRISLADPPPPPVLKVDPPSGMVNEGDPLLLICAITGNNTGKRFHFYKDGVEITSINEEPLRSSSESGDALSNASRIILLEKSYHSREFACRYEEKLNSQWVTSPWSQKVNITVRTPNPSRLLLESFRMALSLLILIVLLAFCCEAEMSASKERQQESEKLEEEKEEENGVRPSWNVQPERTFQLQGSDISKALVTSNSPTLMGPMMQNRLELVKEEDALCEEIPF